jgi:hypothetical protein
MGELRTLPFRLDLAAAFLLVFFDKSITDETGRAGFSGSISIGEFVL